MWPKAPGTGDAHIKASMHLMNSLSMKTWNVADQDPRGYPKLAFQSCVWPNASVWPRKPFWKEWTQQTATFRQLQLWEHQESRWHLIWSKTLPCSVGSCYPMFAPEYVKNYLLLFCNYKTSWSHSTSKHATWANLNPGHDHSLLTQDKLSLNFSEMRAMFSVETRC